jgi:tRNA (cytidine/uridine-2'-O-)-methyltransferase
MRAIAAGAQLHLIEPLGFSLDEPEVKRAGLDYWKHVDPRRWPSWDAFAGTMPELGSPWFFSTKAKTTLWDAAYEKDVCLVFGRETGGLPASLFEEYPDRFVTIPQHHDAIRSLNLSTSVGIALYEVLRQQR